MQSMSNIHMRFPGGRKKALTLSYDDGVEQDIRLIEIMKKNGLKGTFNINSGLYAPEGTVYEKGIIHRRMTKNQATKLYKDSGMEVASHSRTHPFLAKISIQQCREEILEDKHCLEEQFGRTVRGFAYPSGSYNEDVIQCLKDAGICYARNSESSLNFDLPQDWMQVKETCRHADPRLMELAHTFVENKVVGEPWLFFLMGHAYEFESDNNWHVIDEFASYTGNREEIWYATNGEIFDYVEAYQNLIFHRNRNLIYNPTAIDIYFEENGKIFYVKSQQELVM